MQTTIQTKIDGSVKEFLEETAKHIGKLRGKLLSELLNKGNINELKTKYIKEHGLLARQFNSLVNEVKATIASAKELNKRNIQESKDRHKALKKRIKILTKQLKNTYPACGMAGKKPPRKQLLFQIHHKKRKLTNLEAKIAKLQKNKTSICLGTKKLFRKQFHLEENGYEDHQQWLSDFRNARTNRIFYLGSHDETFGNQNCQLIADKLQVRVLPALEKKYGKYVNIYPNFSYGHEIINYAIKNKQAINYRFVRKNNEWYLFLTTKREPVKITSKKELGAIGVDLNKAHLAWAETDRFGNLINFDRINTPTQDRRQHQVKATLGDAESKKLLSMLKRSKNLLLLKS